VISVGVGEDVSFDIEMINRFNARIILIDPTPRSAEYYKKLLIGLGKPATTGYSDSGYQPITSYDLEKVDINQLMFVNKALSNHDGEITLFAPARDTHVSYSSTDFHGTGLEKAKKFTCTTLKDLMIDLNLGMTEIDVLKLDVEGEEYAILNSAFQSNIFPKQICLEIDELNFISFRNYIHTIKILYLLRRNSYRLRGRLAWVEFCAVKA
jgi:FkbM family methyltransferase